MHSTAPKPVLYVNSWSTAHGGSSTSLLDIVRSLDRDRFEPTVVCPEPGDLPDRLAALNVPVIVHPLSRLTRDEIWGFLREVPWYVRLLRQRHVALVHGNTSSSRRSLLQAIRLANVPYVQHVRNGVKNPAARVGCRYAARIIANSNDAGEALYREPSLAGRTMTIYNAVDLEQYDARDTRRAELDAGQRPIVGFAGQLVPRKGVETLIQAMSAVIQQSPEALLVIVGCAPSDETEYEAGCRAMVAELGLSSHVRFVGYRHDIPAWMRTFDVFALPTRSEPFGKVVIEAMAAGTPVVASRVGGIPEIVTSPALGTLIPPDDPAALASAILGYLSNVERARTTGELGRQHVREHFGLRAMMARLHQLYDDILAEHGQRGVAPCAASRVA